MTTVFVGAAAGGTGKSNDTATAVSLESGGGGGMGETDADAVDAAIGAGQDFQTETVLFDDLAGERDVTGDLGDEAAEGGGFVVLGQAEGGGIVARVAGCAVVERIARSHLVAEIVSDEVTGANVAQVVLFGGVAGMGFAFVSGGVGCDSAGCGFELVGEEVAEAREFEGAGDDVGAVRFAHGGVVGLGFVVLVGDVAYDGFEEVFDGDEAGDGAVLVDDHFHVLFFALHLAK